MALIEAIGLKRKMFFEFENAPYHCLDVDQPVVRQLEQEEALLVEALGGALGSAGAAPGAGTGRSPT